MSAEPVHKITGFSALDGEDLLAAIYAADPESLSEDADSDVADQILRQAQRLAVSALKKGSTLEERLLKQPMSSADGARFITLFLRAVALRSTQLQQEKQRVLAEIEDLVASYSLAPDTLLAVEEWASRQLVSSSAARAGSSNHYFVIEPRKRSKRQPT